MNGRASRAQRRAELQGKAMADMKYPAYVARALMETTARYFDLERAPEWDEREAIQSHAANLRAFETIGYHRLARAAFVRDVAARFGLCDELLWHQVRVTDDRKTPAPEIPREVVFMFALPIEGGGELVNAAKGDGILCETYPLRIGGRIVGEVRTMDEVRALQDAHRVRE